MRALHILVVFACLSLLLGCQQQPAVTTVPSATAIADTQPRMPQATHADTLARIATLAHARDSLAQRFEFKRRNLPLGSYYHKTWWASYLIRSEALLAGVDSNGVVFLIHSYSCNRVGPSKCGDGSPDLQLEIGDTSFAIVSDPAIEDSIWGQANAVKRDMVLSTGRQCTDYFLLLGQPLLEQLLADTGAVTARYARVCDGQRKGSRGRVGKRDLAAIRDCVRLGRVLREVGVVSR